jgi:CBS-domain-containing membrane protein
MNISSCMKRNVFSIPTSATIGDAVSILIEKHIGLLPVVDAQGKPVGVLGLRELLSLALPSFVDLISDLDFLPDFGAVENSQPTAEILARPVTTLMRPATTVKEYCGLLRAFAFMRQHKLHDLPVVDEQGALVGIASRVDIGTAILASWQTRTGAGP